MNGQWTDAMNGACRVQSQCNERFRQFRSLNLLYLCQRIVISFTDGNRYFQYCRWEIRTVWVLVRSEKYFWNVRLSGTSSISCRDNYFAAMSWQVRSWEQGRTHLRKLDSKTWGFRVLNPHLNPHLRIQRCCLPLSAPRAINTTTNDYEIVQQI